MFFYPYLIVDIFCRKIVGWEVYEREGADLAAMLIQKAVWSEACISRPLVPYADNGIPLVVCRQITAGQRMKGATMNVTQEKRASWRPTAARASATTTHSPRR